MAGRLTRFLNLEKRRTSPEPPSHEVVTKARFGGPEPELVLDTGGGLRPFIRCFSCEADNNRGAERCFNCQAPLQSDEARAWNEAYWTKRQHDEAFASGEAPIPPPPISAPLSEESRRLAEALAREVGKNEQLRLSGWWGGGSDDPSPIGLRILRSIENSSVQVTAGAVSVALFIGSGAVYFMASPRSVWRTVALAVGTILFALFTPNFPRRRRWWW